MLKIPFLKYSIVGVSGTFIDLIFLYILVDVYSYPVISSAIISFILAATNNFIFNQLWTFKDEKETKLDKKYHIKYLKFMIISTIGLCFTVILMYILHNVLFLWYILAKIMTSAVVLLWNYYANKNWTFKIRHQYR
jgi:putative flippase GtrA